MIQILANTTMTLLTITHLAAALWLAVWSYRKFGITVFGWMVIVRAVDVITHMAVVLPSPRESMDVITKIGELLEPNPWQAFYLHAVAKTGFPMLSTLILVIYAAAEIAHFGPRLVEGFTAPPWLTRVYRFRHWVGVSAVLFGAAYWLTMAWLVHFVL